MTLIYALYAIVGIIASIVLIGGVVLTIIRDKKRINQKANKSKEG